MWGDWRDRYVHGMFIIWPPDDVRSPINALRERFDPDSAAICEAHITLTQPFVDSPSDDDWSTLKQIVAAYQPIDIVYGTVKTFLPYPCLYLEVEPVVAFTRLHEALQGCGLFHPAPSNHERCVPHLTILENTMTAEETARLASELQESAPSGTFVCREIAFIVPDDQFHFAVERTLPLGAAFGRVVDDEQSGRTGP
ncbi:MAG: 2'-5' RNA ligase family protein [Vicinamibacterales bacterium]